MGKVWTFLSSPPQVWVKLSIPVLLLACSEDFFFFSHLTFLISSHIVFNSIRGLLIWSLKPNMANGIRTGNPHGFNKGRSSKFREGSRVRQTPEEGWRTYQPKHCGNNNKDEDDSPKTLNDKNQQASSQKFRLLLIVLFTLSLKVSSIPIKHK